SRPRGSGPSPNSSGPHTRARLQLRRRSPRRTGNERRPETNKAKISSYEFVRSDAKTIRRRREREAAELRSWNSNPWLMWEQELAPLLPTRPKLAAEIAAKKAEWARLRRRYPRC